MYTPVGKPVVQLARHSNESIKVTVESFEFSYPMNNVIVLSIFIWGFYSGYAVGKV
jgi:hypothetical protein